VVPLSQVKPLIPVPVSAYFITAPCVCALSFDCSTESGFAWTSGVGFCVSDHEVFGSSLLRHAITYSLGSGPGFLLGFCVLIECIASGLMRNG